MTNDKEKVSKGKAKEYEEGRKDRREEGREGYLLVFHRKMLANICEV